MERRFLWSPYLETSQQTFDFFSLEWYRKNYKLWEHTMGTRSLGKLQHQMSTVPPYPGSLFSFISVLKCFSNSSSALSILTIKCFGTLLLLLPTYPLLFVQLMLGRTEQSSNFRIPSRASPDNENALSGCVFQNKSLPGASVGLFAYY